MNICHRRVPAVVISPLSGTMSSREPDRTFAFYSAQEFFWL